MANTAGVHTCSLCNKEKPLTEFSIDKKRRPGKPVSYCKPCRAMQSKQYRKENKDKVSATEFKSRIKLTYGISVEKYNHMLENQGKSCAICKSKKPGGRTKLFFIDHCHDTGNVRGLLCMRCNTGLGLFRDNTKFLNQAITYLKGN